MAELGFLDQNENRAYPFQVGVDDQPYRRVVVDLFVRLGEDHPFDLATSAYDFRLVRVEDDPVDFRWDFFFSRYINGSDQGDEILVRVPKNAPRFSTHHGSSGVGTYVYLTVGQIQQMVAEPAADAPLELRTVVAPNNGRPSQVQVFNAKRRQSYIPYFTANPNSSPAQDYLNAKAAAPAHQPNVVAEAGTTVPAGPDDLVEVVAGYSLELSADSATRQIVLRYRLGGGEGPDCRQIEAADLLTRQKALQAVGSLRPDADGRLTLEVGAGLQLISEPDQTRIRLVVERPEPDTECLVTDAARNDPPDLPEPPTNCEE